MNFSQSLYFYGSPIIAVLAFALNLPEIILLLKRYRKVSKSQSECRVVPIILLTSLAVSDLFVGLTVMLIKVLHYFVKEEVIPVNEVSLKMNKILKFLFLRLSLLTSIFSLLAITIDRLFSVRNPISYRTRVQPWHGFMAVFGTWSFSSILIILHYYLSVYDEIEAIKYRLLIFPITIFPASVVFTLCYFKILRNVFEQGVEIRQHVRHMAGKCPRYIIERELKVSRFAATVVCVFMLSWLPLAFTGLLNILGVEIEDDFPNSMFLLAFTNSVVNPLIYFAFKEKFCLHLQTILSLLSRKKRPRRRTIEN